MPTAIALARETLRGPELALRPATLDDVPWVADLLTKRDPTEPANVGQMRHWWALSDPGRVQDRWIVQEGETPIGLAYHEHASWSIAPMRASRVNAWFLRDAGRPARLARAFALVEPFAAADGAELFMTGTREGQDDEYAALIGLGYKEERRSKSWELDLDRNRATIAAMAAASRERMRAEGIEITTIDRVADPEKWRKLHAMVEASIQDIPTTVPHAPESFESFMQWMSSPGLHADRLWVAREGSAIVGMSVLDYPPGVGNVWTDYTGTSRAVRGRGIARALKCETVTQAIELGVARVRTNNDGQNAPILHLNEEMGYTRIPGHIQLLKPATARL
ncbi:MAG TPA: GNAT family N-acetyltransferase [Candidatus Limnocylindria bacterium]|nr:GNAT family N-acetyltransferase [Candidatus Limnocylindria bacterium]